MAWLQTKRDCLSRRKCVVALLFILLNIVLLFRLYSKGIINLGNKQLDQMQLPKYSQSMQKLDENEERDHASVVNKVVQVLQPWITHYIMDRLNDETKQDVVGKRSKPTDGVMDVNPLYDFIKYPCLKGLPLLSANTSLTNRNCVRTINLTAMKDINTENCVSLKTPTGSTPICTYRPEEDIPISRDIHKNGHFEQRMVAELGRVLKSHTDLELFDIGCNIGVYTLSMAHQGINVTAIDPVIENIQLLSKSVKLGNFDNKVTLIWNALSNEHKAVALRKFKHKVGLTQIKDVKRSTVNTDDLNLTRTIMLDDLLPIFKGKRVVFKMDIEKSEYYALLGGKKFFNEIDVPIIQMEIGHHTKTKTGPMIVKYLLSYRFRPSRDIRGEFLLDPSHISRWPHDVYFIRPYI